MTDVKLIERIKKLHVINGFLSVRVEVRNEIIAALERLLPIDAGTHVLVPVEVINKSTRRHWLPYGECQYCDDKRNDMMMPYHDASNNCESGKHSHCTCDTCY